MEIPRHWRLKKQRYNLVGEICSHCDHKIFPPRGICPNCGGEIKEVSAFSGKIDSYTTVYKPGVKETPIAVVFQQPVEA
jgi:uncharacterized OB-fold protein